MDESILGNTVGALIGRNNNGLDGFGGGAGIMWVVLIALLFGGGFGGFGGFGGRGFPPNVATTNDVFASAGWQQTQDALGNVTNAINGVNQNLSNLGYNSLAQANAINQNISTLGYNALAQANTINQNISQQGADSRLQACQNTNNITNGLANLGYAMNNGQQMLAREIEQNRFDNAQQTCNITTNSTANTQRILDVICDWRAEQKSQKINELQAQLAQAQTVSAIVGQLQPTPRPAYWVSSPYQSINPLYGGYGSYGNFT